MQLRTQELGNRAALIFISKYKMNDFTSDFARSLGGY